MNRFARDIGILKGQIPYDKVVATQFTELWRTSHFCGMDRAQANA
jgi:hypothetical protein